MRLASTKKIYRHSGCDKLFRLHWAEQPTPSKKNGNSEIWALNTTE